MERKDIAIVFDCGATNVRVIAMNISGTIVASESMPNETDGDPHFPGGRIWDVDKLWDKLCGCSRKVLNQIDSGRIAGVTFTTFGVDGALVDNTGELLYPVISWQCDRTKPIMDNIDKYCSLNRLYQLSGVYPYAFNTINKMIWLKENQPDLIEKAFRFLFMPSLLIHRLTGTMQNDATMMGTSMMTDLKNRCFSDEILSSLNINKDLFGEMAEPGDIAGAVHVEGSLSTGIPENTSVFFAGHDTQFAVFGSGAKLNQPVLSSGTWEVLMVRTDSFAATQSELDENLTTEADAIKGFFNIGQNWLGSGVLEWFSSNFYPELKGNQLYETMISEASDIKTGEHGLCISPAFYDDGTGKGGGIISGLTISSKREEIYRALLESMALRLREGLFAIEKAGDFKAESIICVGGGSKNGLWNQLRADAIQRPLHVIDQKETTVLGAALFVFQGAGLYSSAEEALNAIKNNSEIILPKKDDSSLWDRLFMEYLKLKIKD
ncbi:L-fuculokinase [Carboxylicivirga linearis]|uniref:L-fuculokinase n=1 Tax=Carboxylicivirga linearis TaxID=1628157 RepID=A0ABS5JY49_9BACT|nr:L-fuculokinase [Carboxylicivirga linearis]MBS2099832.1 L-fuculokinase [Carboxylicivirga linearis]